MGQDERGWVVKAEEGETEGSGGRWGGHALERGGEGGKAPPCPPPPPPPGVDRPFRPNRSRPSSTDHRSLCNR